MTEAGRSLNQRFCEQFWTIVAYFMMFLFLSAFVGGFLEVVYWLKNAEWHLLRLSDLFDVKHVDVEMKGLAVIMDWILSIPYIIAAPVAAALCFILVGSEMEKCKHRNSDDIGFEDD